MSEVAGDMMYRINFLSDRLDKIEAQMTNTHECNIALRSEVRAMREEFSSLKTDVLITVQDHTDKTWKLINNAWRIITVLIGIIILFSGVKMGPELLKALLS